MLYNIIMQYRTLVHILELRKEHIELEQNKWNFLKMLTRTKQ